MRNRELYEKYRDFVIASLRLLREKVANGEEIPRLIVDKITVERESDGAKRIHTTEVMEPNISSFVYEHKKEIMGQPEFSPCFDCLEGLDFIKEYYQKTLDLKIIRKNLERTCLISVLTYYIRRSRSLDYNANIFGEMYDEVENYLYTGISRRLALAPLDNFEMEDDVLDLGNNLKIRKISGDELGEFVGKYKIRLGATIPLNEALKIEYVMEMPQSFERGEPIVEPRESFSELVSALRLFKSGEVGFNVIRSFPISWQPMTATTGFKKLFSIPYSGPEYKLTESEIGDFKEFWREFSTLDLNKNKFLEVAINRFNYGYEREKPEDKFIDYMIALEALFLREEEKAELSYRLSNRTAIFLDREKTVWENVRKAYDLRSKIVHGSAKPLPGDRRELVLKIEEYLRESIKRFLKLIKTQNYEEIIESIDKQIFI